MRTAPAVREIALSNTSVANDAPSRGDTQRGAAKREYHYFQGYHSMKVQYDNQQDNSDPMNGSIVAGDAQLIELLDSRRRDPPFFACFSADNGFQIMVGIGKDIGCIQHSRSDGQRPYLMAVSADPPMKAGYVEFLAGGTLTPCAARYIIRLNELKEIALHFLKTGERSRTVSWQLLDPKAVREDAARAKQ